MSEIPRSETLAGCLSTWVTAIRRRLLPHDSIALRLEEMRLEYLVLALLEIDETEATHLEGLSGPEASFNRYPESFYHTLQQAIRQLRLFKLFVRTPGGNHHRSVCPTAYNERTGEHYPEEKARWRADFRAMNPEQQMMAATIIWLYRSGSDSIWLRRVSCTWKASEALHYMHDAGCLALWLQLIARYPGW